VIIATHYPFYDGMGMYATRIFPYRSYALGVKIKDKYPGGMYITAEDPGRSLRLLKSGDEELIMVGGEHHKTGQGEDTINHYINLKNFAYDNFDVQDIPYRWSTQDYTTMDEAPYIGHLTSATPNLYVATGFAKWGMTNSIVSAMIFSNLITKGESPWEDVYNPSRFTVAASAKKFVTENANVAKELIKGKLAPVPDDLDIKPGEGKAIEINGQRVGAYMDEKGHLHLVDPTCTHLGCELQWNSAEKSWDCPCHGSRFDKDGNVLNTPSIHGLKSPVTKETKK
jgi:Rieske Fe-S protein